MVTRWVAYTMHDSLPQGSIVYEYRPTLSQFLLDYMAHNSSMWSMHVDSFVPVNTSSCMLLHYTITCRVC